MKAKQLRVKQRCVRLSQQLSGANERKSDELNERFIHPIHALAHPSRRIGR